MGFRLYYISGILAILISSYALGAVVHGNVYDLSLNKVQGAIVEVNTTPAQFYIAKDGTYSLDIQRGTYLIAAEEKENGQVLSLENRTIAVLQDGNYVIDFILFPVIEEEALEDFDVSDVAGSDTYAMNIALIVVAALLTGGILFAYFRKKDKTAGVYKGEEKKAETKEPREKESPDDYLAQTLAVVRKNGGRATQKDIRKEIPLSEAKISLLIAELEHKGKIEKIKRGRGNIILLK